jgi:hypothetical protein
MVEIAVAMVTKMSMHGRGYNHLNKLALCGAILRVHGLRVPGLVRIRCRDSWLSAYIQTRNMPAIPDPKLALHFTESD